MEGGGDARVAESGTRRSVEGGEVVGWACFASPWLVRGRIGRARYLCALIFRREVYPERLMLAIPESI